MLAPVSRLRLPRAVVGFVGENNLKDSQRFYFTRSYAALWAADLDWIVGPGYSLGGYILEKNHEKPTCLFFVTYAGSQLTFMTQNEKVHIFRYLRGVTTDFHDTE